MNLGVAASRQTAAIPRSSFQSRPGGTETPLRSGSHGINVYFELGPGDDYVGKPDTWHLLAQVPKPANTVFYTENATSADHVMAQSWMSLADAEVQVAYQRHRQKSNCTFADGHVETCKLARAYDPAQGVDLWNPSLAW